MKLTHIDLFSGIGGFSLAARWAGIQTVQFVEIDKFCQQVLRKNFPGIPIHDDIKTFDGTKYPNVFLLTGGFPCQPFSCAGKQRGTDDNRYLWPEMLRVISEVRPCWIIGENVAGINSLFQYDSFSEMEGKEYLTPEDAKADFKGISERTGTNSLWVVLDDLEKIGYSVQTCIIPACAVNAPHRRDRVWIVANSERHRFNGKEISVQSGQSRQEGTLFARADCHAPDTEKSKCELSGRTRTGREGFTDVCFDAPDSSNQRLQGCERPGSHGEGQAAHGSITERNNTWDEPWIEAAQRFCQLDARISNRLDGCLTLPETYGIMGFILMLRRFHYATSKETRTGEILRVLQEAFDEESVQRCFRRLSEIFEAEDLRCPVHGENDGERKENEVCLSEGSGKISGEIVREMRSNNNLINSSQGRGLEKQCTCEFDDIVFELSSEIALGEWKRNSKKAENILFNLWKKSRGERFLYEPLPALYEIWRSVTDQEIGAFKRHYLKRNEYRVQKLKALGNAVVPQIPFLIMTGILDLYTMRKDGF